MTARHPLLVLSPLLALAWAASACRSVSYGDPEATETVSVEWGSTDLQTFSRRMTESLLEAPQLAFQEAPRTRDDPRIVVYMGGVRNETSEHVDTQGVTDVIRSELLRSGRFRFVAGEQGQGEIGEQVRFQQGSGRVDPEQAKAFGKQLGADVVLYGTLRSIEKKSSGLSKTKDVYYQLVMNAVGIESGELIWSDVADLRKQEKRGPF
jgi:uncharacterized protein (TIGR02722 family)